MTEKRKTKFREETGPFGVGDSVEDIENLNIFETITTQEGFDDLLKDLDEDQKKHVMKETLEMSDKYQHVLTKITEILSSKEAQQKFKEMAMKKAGEK